MSLNKEYASPVKNQNSFLVLLMTVKLETMDCTIYECSLGVALVLMLFFAVYFLTAKTPDRPIFANYVRSRRIMGVALFICFSGCASRVLVRLY